MKKDHSQLVSKVTGKQSSGDLSRRHFMGITAGLYPVLGGLHLGTVQSAATASTLPERLFELGTVTYMLGAQWTMEELIGNCEAAGFKAVELRTTHRHGVEPTLSRSERRAVRDRFAQSDVKLLCLGTTCEYHSPDQDVVRENIQVSRQFIELASDVGARAIKVRPNGIPKEVELEVTLRQIGSALREVGRIGDDHGVDIWVEVHGRDSSHPPHMKKMMDYCGHSRVGLTWNCNDSDLKDGQIQPYFDLLKSHIRNVHLHEMISDYPFSDLFGLLRQMNYSGYTLAEIPGVKEDPVRFMRYFRALWDALSS